MLLERMIFELKSKRLEDTTMCLSGRKRKDIDTYTYLCVCIYKYLYIYMLPNMNMYLSILFYYHMNKYIQTFLI